MIVFTVTNLISSSHTALSPGHAPAPVAVWIGYGFSKSSRSGSLFLTSSFLSLALSSCILLQAARGQTASPISCLKTSARYSGPLFTSSTFRPKESPIQPSFQLLSGRIDFPPASSPVLLCLRSHHVLFMTIKKSSKMTE